jgi:hypothetical protein
MSHNSGGVTNLRKKFVSKFEESPLEDDEGGVGGLNRTPLGEITSNSVLVP